MDLTSPASPRAETEKPSEAMGMQWGDKGCAYRPDLCNHGVDDGCMWCCMRCNTDTHWCPGCGTVTDHKGTACDDCGGGDEVGRVAPDDPTAGRSDP